MAITLYPAVDLLGGKAVRLEQGDYERSKIYDLDPVDAARRWVDGGARCMHVVDLDGARDGHPVNLDQLRAIRAALEVPIQYGGGLRSVDAARAAVAAGAERVVLGTVAFKDVEVLDGALGALGDHVAVSVDVREGRVATDGWIDRTELDGVEAIVKLRERGVENIIYTNVDLDGTLSGVRPSEVKQISDAVGDGRLVWSGGIGFLDDLRTLAKLELANLDAVIVGKALYERRFTVKEALEALS